MTSGVWKVAPNVAECCKTFHEYEPWLEVDMLALYHLKYVYRPHSGRPLPFIDTCPSFGKVLLELTLVPFPCVAQECPCPAPHRAAR